ncbi:MAG: hypothetical protein ABI847_16990, partial [Anaerolineales bacterium]
MEWRAVIVHTKALKLTKALAQGLIESDVAVDQRLVAPTSVRAKHPAKVCAASQQFVPDAS